MSRFGAFQFYGNGRGGAFGGAAVRMAERAGQTPSLEIFANNRDIHLPVSLRRQDRVHAYFLKTMLAVQAGAGLEEPVRDGPVPAGLEPHGRR